MTAVAHADVVHHKSSDEANEVAFLVHTGTADSLATASLLTYLLQGSGEGSLSRDPVRLMERAVTKGPMRPELVWLRLRECQQRRCAEEPAIAASLKALDSDNGLAWLTDLRAAQFQSPEEVTKVLDTMGDRPKPTFRIHRTPCRLREANAQTRDGGLSSCSESQRGAAPGLVVVSES
jgi:hypothetical protein